MKKYIIHSKINVEIAGAGTTNEAPIIREITEEEVESLIEKNPEIQEKFQNSTLWVIWSMEHEAWWKAGHAGYTLVKAEAGIYGYKEALEIVANANKHTDDYPNEAMIQIA